MKFIMPDDFREELLFNSPYIPKFTTPEEFANARIEMLREQFKIEMSEEDEAYLRGFKTEFEINAAFRTIINKYWE